MGKEDELSLKEHLGNDRRGTRAAGAGLREVLV